MFELKFTRKWEAAHRFIEGENAGTLCSQPHGHTWSVTVTLIPTAPGRLNGTTNTVVLFHKAKKRWHDFIDNAMDHSFAMNERDPLAAQITALNPSGRHVMTPGDPTTELLAVCFKAKLEAFLKDEGLPLNCTRVEIQETPTNAVAFLGDPSEFIGQGWWNKADLSTR